MTYFYCQGFDESCFKQQNIRVETTGNRMFRRLHFLFSLTYVHALNIIEVLK